MNPHTPHPDEGPASADRPATDLSRPELPESDLPEPERTEPERPAADLPHTERSVPELPGTGQPAPAFSGPGGAPPEPPRLYPPGDPNGPLPGRQTQNFFDWIRSQGIYRGRDRWIGGVASGIAHRLGVDPLIIRGVLIVLTVFAGIGVLAYGLAWALLPEPDGRIHVQEAAAGRWTAGMTGALITSVIGFPSLGTGVWGWDRFGFGAFVWTVFWVGGAIYLVYYLTQRNKIRDGATAMPSHYDSGSPTGAAAFAASPRTAAGPPSAGSFPQGSGRTYGDPADSSRVTGTGPDWGPPPPSGPIASGPVPPGPVPPDGYGPGSGATPPAPAARNLGPGAPAVAITVGSALLVGGSIKALDAANVIDLGDAGNALVWAFGAAILGLGILFAGLRGRTSGILGFFSVVALLIGAIFSVVPHGDRFRFQNADWAPASIQQAQGGFEITGGAGTVDLTKLALNPPLGSDVVVPIDATASNLTVVIPATVPVHVQADMTMGNLHDGNQDRGGMTTQQSDYNTAKPGARLVLEISGTVSNVTIKEGN
ncbi:PspC domain-containing protein [Arthrobacter humicola]|uniref:PspC domain-containing protein n=1 Tax=Arthrobacter humicola TaxID=409291 RepID=UPI001FAD9E2C|nr:PspC domain-containing protein [Arthrobacter humicola]MCI9871584.1 PspC domain-containing protein [Arthrobacter humicola]